MGEYKQKELDLLADSGKPFRPTDDYLQFLSQVENSLGPVAATMFVEGGKDRHLIPELIIAAVVQKIISKYIENFIEGAGVKDFGKQHGKAISGAIKHASDILSGTEQPDKKELEKDGQTIFQIVVLLRAYRSDKKGKEKGFAELLLILREHGIPNSEAERIAKDMEKVIWQE